MKNLMKTIMKNTAIGLFITTGMVATLQATPHTLDDSHSEVGFSVKHLMITNVKGTFKGFTGTIDYDYKKGVFNAFEGVIKVGTIDTGIAKRDNHLRSDDFFYVDKYPKLTFKMKKYIKEDAEEGVMIGDLTMRGVTKEVKLNVEEIGTIKDFKGNNRVGFTLKGKVNRKDYGLNWNKAIETGGFAVGNKVKLTAEIEAIEN